MGKIARKLFSESVGVDVVKSFVCNPIHLFIHPQKNEEERNRISNGLNMIYIENETLAHRVCKQK